MKTRPILFNAEMVRAILDGRKTQTRRVVKPSKSRLPYHQLMDHDPETGIWGLAWGGAAHGGFVDGCDDLRCPYGTPGDRLWVRGTFHLSPDGVEYRADDGSETEYMAGDRPVWKPSIHMPRWASRITLEVLSVRVERVQEMGTADAFLEGCPRAIAGRDGDIEAAHLWFRRLWDTINAKRGYGWAANPWVWVVGFKVVG